jgi:hypothetical protein
MITDIKKCFEAQLEKATIATPEAIEASIELRKSQRTLDEPHEHFEKTMQYLRGKVGQKKFYYLFVGPLGNGVANTTMEIRTVWEDELDQLAEELVDYKWNPISGSELPRIFHKSNNL